MAIGGTTFAVMLTDSAWGARISREMQVTEDLIEYHPWRSEDSVNRKKLEDSACEYYGSSNSTMARSA